MDLTQYLYARISSQLYGSNFSSPVRQPCSKNASSPELAKANKVQALVSSKLLYLGLSINLPSLFTTVLIGANSDRLGRRFLFFFSITGLFCRDAGKMLMLACVTTAVAFFDLDLNWLFVGFVLNAFIGGTFTITLAVNSYTADNTPASRARTLAIGLAGAAAAVAMVAGSLGGGYFIQLVGFSYPFLTVSGLVLLTLIITAVCIEETNPEVLGPGSDRQWPTPWQAVKSVFGFYFSKSVSAEPGLTSETTTSAVSVHESRHQRDIHDIMNNQSRLAGSDESIEPAVEGQWNPTDRRPEYILGIVVFFFSVLPELGLGTIDMLYVMNAPFCWEAKKIGTYNTVRGLLQKFVSLAALRGLSAVVREEWVGVLGFLSMACGFVIMGLADRDWMMYLTPAVGLLASLASIVVKSIMSQRAPPGKQGSLFAGLSVLETACMVLGGLIFNNVYSATVTVFRGATFFLTSAIAALGALLMVAYIVVIRRSDNCRTYTGTIQGPS
ncbi:proton-coupled folate transporter-like [Littorina saxatilis]|uniref:proton-coupled folate transporter-like n=1 Tax=Littorina saxatilis TaxID=31220 RepID=UPI0038B53BF1